MSQEAAGNRTDGSPHPHHATAVADRIRRPPQNAEQITAVCGRPP